MGQPGDIFCRRLGEVGSKILEKSRRELKEIGKVEGSRMGVKS